MKIIIKLLSLEVAKFIIGLFFALLAIIYIAGVIGIFLKVILFIIK